MYCDVGSRVLMVYCNNLDLLENLRLLNVGFFALILNKIPQNNHIVFLLLLIIRFSELISNGNRWNSSRATKRHYILWNFVMHVSRNTDALCLVNTSLIFAPRKLPFLRCLPNTCFEWKMIFIHASCVFCLLLSGVILGFW